MVEKPVDYGWSSYHHNAQGIKDDLITEHELYKNIAKDSAHRRLHYQGFFDKPISQHEDARIADAKLKGEVYGSDAFHQKVGSLVGRVTKLGNHGGDRKSENYKKDQAG